MFNNLFLAYLESLVFFQFVVHHYLHIGVGSVPDYAFQLFGVRKHGNWAGTVDTAYVFSAVRLDNNVVGRFYGKIIGTDVVVFSAALELQFIDYNVFVYVVLF